MLFHLLAFFRKIAVGVLAVISIGCLVAVFIPRLPDQEICLYLYHYSTSQSGNYGQVILDTTNGRFEADTRNMVTALSIRSPDGQKSIFLKPVPHETDVYDLYLDAGDLPIKSRLLQQGVRYASGNTQLLGDQLRWSRDSNRLAFLWSNSNQDFFLTLATLDNQPTKTITPFAKDPSKAFYTRLQEWSADDRYFSVIEQVLNDTRYTFWDANTLTSVSYPLSAASMVRGVWSPNGHTFASIVRNDNQKPTHLMILNSEESDAVIQIPLAPNDIQHLMWSPDGKALVIGYLTCDQANCRQQWHYDLFQSDGVPMATNLTGSFVNSTNISGSTTYGPDGRTSFSGFPFNGAWSNDGKRFIYLEQTTSGDHMSYSVSSFDSDKQQQLTEATYEGVNFSNSYFHIMKYTTLSSRIMEPIPTVPLSDQIIMPYIENGKISVALTGGSLQKPIVLVSNADHLLPLPSLNLQGQYWATDWYGVDHIIIEWSTGEGKDKRLHLTMSDGNGNNIQTIEEDLDDISNMNFIYAKERPLLGFIGKKGELNNLYMLDVDTGKQTLVLKDVEDNGEWQVIFNPQLTMMAVRGDVIQPGGGQLYLRYDNSDALIKVDANPRSSTSWSEDGQKLALIGGNANGSQDLLVIGADGKRIKQFPISRNSVQNFIPEQWSKCY